MEITPVDLLSKNTLKGIYRFMATQFLAYMYRLS